MTDEELKEKLPQTETVTSWLYAAHLAEAQSLAKSTKP
jgi:hypothetical protein